MFFQPFKIVVYLFVFKYSATRCDPNPCKNEGTCQNDENKIDGYVCMCPTEFTGRRCQGKTYFNILLRY